MSIEKEVAKQLMQIKAIKLNPQNPFTWASGRKSPIYCDNRLLLSYPNVRKYIKQSLVEESKDYQFNMIAGVATAGIPHGSLLADALDMPFVYVRSKAKAHGRQNMIEGELRGNERVLIIEDLISTGGSCLQAVDALETTGCRIEGVMAIFTYGFAEAERRFAEADCKFSTLSNYDVLLEEALACDYINSDDIQRLKDWRKDPVAWSEQFVNS